MNAQVIIDRLLQRDMLELVDDVCRKHHVTRSEVCGDWRAAHVCRARQEVWLRLHRDHGWSSSAIGRLFGRDHSTVHAGMIRAADRMLAQ